MKLRQALSKLVIATSATLLAACATSDNDRFQEELASGEIIIKTDGASGVVDLSGTFDYAPGSTVSLIDNRFDSFSVEGELRSSLERQLRGLGLTRAARSGADYLVGYRLSSTEQGKVTDAVRTMGLQPVFTKSDRPLTRGALLIAIASTRTNQVVWRGSVEGAIDPTRTEKERAERLDRAIALLLERL